MNKLTFGILGDGFIAPRHKEAIDKIGGDLIWICDKDVCKIQKDGKWTATTKKDYLDMVLPDYVAVCTPNNTHNDYINYFASMGCKVLTEKPPVLKSDQIERFGKYIPVYVVLQLHYHPEVIKMKQKLNPFEKHKGYIMVKVKRDPAYWNSWKGKDEESGGILFNLGIHYIELLMHLFGNEVKIVTEKIYKDKKKSAGVLDFDGNEFCYYFEIMDTDDGQDRKLVIDGEEISLSKKDNLSFEDLHTKVYEEMVAGHGIHIQECYNVIKLIEKLS